MRKLSRREESEILEEDQDVQLSTQYAGWESEWGDGSSLLDVPPEVYKPRTIAELLTEQKRMIGKAPRNPVPSYPVGICPLCGIYVFLSRKNRRPLPHRRCVAGCRIPTGA